MFKLVLLAAVLVAECQAQCIGLTCKECISSGYSCSWCRQTNFSRSRCQPRGSLLKSGCEDTNIESPLSYIQIVENEEVGDSYDEDVPAVQIQPQRVHIKARIREDYRLSMTFRAANNFPVDLYFLFDNSNTMESQIKNLAKLASDIGQSIGSVSRNYRIVYGVFQDKVILPFTDTAKIKLENPCYQRNLPTSCSPPFEFKHVLNMTSNILEFKERVDQTRVTSNIDHPEGSLDAILQAITCQSVIHWRAVGHKLLIIATNDRFHLAGDGRLAGIVIPNDGQCHLDSNGKYTEELVQDYPTVSQLADIVQKNEVHIIFVASSDQVPLFRLLSQRIPQSIVELLASPQDTSNRNIKQIIEKKYKEKVTEVKIAHSKIKGVEVQIKATSGICEKQGTSECKDLRIAIPIKFDVEVKVTECPSSPDERVKKVIIYPESMKNEQMVLEIETICECECSTKQETWQINSDLCTDGNGTLMCGICECHPGRFGQFCENCSSDLDPAISGCIRPGDHYALQCSGTGRCHCGECKCDEGYSGPYCNCNNRACASYHREICGGIRGHCVCGECICEPKYTGIACECLASNATCLYDEKMCNSAGTCECGECRCKKEGYVGKYCENCFLCGDDVCDVQAYRQCAECAISNKEDDCTEKHCPEIIPVASLENTDNDVSGVCAIKQVDGCFLFFHIVTSNASVTILVQKTTTCPETVNVVPIALGLVGGVVAIGLLLLLLWKILTTTHDRIEYSRYMEDLRKCNQTQQDIQFCEEESTILENPLLNTTKV